MEKLTMKHRLSNIELCRIASILLVMLVHTTTESLGDVNSLGVLLLKGFSIVGVNVFVMITGYFSVIPKKSSLINLTFICFFWMIVTVICRCICREPITYKHLFFITSSNWFIPSYIGLLFFAPILNVFCNSVSKRTLWGGVTALIIIEVWFDLIPPHPTISLGTHGGYSLLSFIILYLMARAIRLYGLPILLMNICPILYIMASVFLGCIAYVLLLTGHGVLTAMVFAYSNPIVILSSVAFLMTFEKINLKSSFTNHIAKSTLAVLLGHTSIYYLYTKQFRFLYEHFTGVKVVMYWILSIVIVFIASILIDQVRILLWKPINRFMILHIKTDIII